MEIGPVLICRIMEEKSASRTTSESFITTCCSDKEWHAVSSWLTKTLQIGKALIGIKKP
ncbi:Uncharacterised protein [Legionella maceachernii]|nr:Uncharacterised protein [Legionella maceachernii]